MPIPGMGRLGAPVWDAVMWTRKGKGVDLMSLRKRLTAALLGGVLALALCVPAE